MDESEYSNYFTCLMINTLSAGMVPDCSKAIDADKCFISFKHVVICLCLLRIYSKYRGSNYSVTPFLKMAISLYPFISLRTSSPLAADIILSMNLSRSFFIGVPSRSSPALKSIQLGLRL